ncbi:hypothetical protein DFP73DRAFT_634835 [Morchella snyderi]|nr:hypothetical protein DFP73DRAFT_634835 [Morchella snyderi]
MIRLFAQRGVRMATGRVARRGHTGGGVGDAGVLRETGGKEGPETSRETGVGARQGRVPGSDERLWERVSRLDDRVAGLSKDLADFKGDVNRGLGELAARMDAGFGRMGGDHGELDPGMERRHGELKTTIDKNHAELNTTIDRNHAELRADIKILVWQVRILLVGGSLHHPPQAANAILTEPTTHRTDQPHLDLVLPRFQGEHSGQGVSIWDHQSPPCLFPPGLDAPARHNTAPSLHPALPPVSARAVPSTIADPPPPTAAHTQRATSHLAERQLDAPATTGPWSRAVDGLFSGVNDGEDNAGVDGGVSAWLLTSRE